MHCDRRATSCTSLLAAASMAGAVGGVSPSAGAGEVLHLLLGEGLRNREWRLADRGADAKGCEAKV
jgi:hypothetical protein